MATAVADVRVVKWGNSQGIRIPRNVSDAAGLLVGDDVRLTVEGKRIILERADARPRYKRAGNRSIEEVFAGYSGSPEGEERIRGRVGAEALDD